MQLGRIAIVCLLAIALAACATPPAATPSASAPSASPEPSNALDDPVIESAGLASLTGGQVCGLLTASEASALLGGRLMADPAGVSQPGDHADCVYQDASALLTGTYIKVDLSALGFGAEATMVNLHRGAHTLRVGGFEAIGADAETDPAIENAVLSVKLARASTDPALWIEAPTSSIARQAAVLILPRLAALPQVP
jgi:hypothetical protein